MSSSFITTAGIEELYAKITLKEEEERGIIFDENTGKMMLLIFVGV